MNNTPNLYDTIFSDDDELDVGMVALNELYNHLNVAEMSNYHSLAEYNKIVNDFNSNMLSIIHLNIRSLETNFIQLEALLSIIPPPDIIALSETWLNNDNKEINKIDGYCYHHIVRQGKIRGGVGLYIKNSFNFEVLNQFSYVSNEIEICTVVLNINLKSYTIAVVYRPHQKFDNIKEFRKELAPILKSKYFKKSNTIIVGDFNINLLQHSEHQETNEFLNFMQTFNYIPLITRPTRFPIGEQAGIPSLLDHIYINFAPPAIPGILNYDMTDHLPVFLNIQLPQAVVATHTIKFRLFSDANQTKFTRSIAHVIWEEILIENDLDKNFNIFFDTFTKIYNECFPLVTKNISNKQKMRPWITKGILNSIRRKNNLFKNFKLGLISENEYKTYKNRLIFILKIAKKRYFVRLFTNYRNNTRKLWQSINNLTKNTYAWTKIDRIVVDNKRLSSPSDMSDAFNDFFVNIASRLESNLPKTDLDPLDNLSPRNINEMPIPNISLNEVVKVIKSLKNKTCNTNDFAPKIIKNNVHLLATPLTQLINQSVSQGKFPQKLKTATVIPLYKKGDKSDLNNFRPISLLNVFSNVFERVIKKHLVDFIEENSIISSSQFGFQKGKSTEDALRIFSEKTYKTLDKSKHALSIFIDFSKAFDTVPHNILTL